VGYMGGQQPGPTYRKVCSSPTWSDWAEAVQVDFDESKTTYEELLEAFWKGHAPEMGSRKRQYMSAIFYHTPEQKAAAEASMEAQNAKRKRPVATVIEPSTDFYEAEAYHQKWLLQRKADYFKTLQLSDTRDLVESHAARFGFTCTCVTAESKARV